MNTQQAALNAATQMVSLMGAFVSLSNQVDAFLKNYKQNNYDGIWMHLPTVAVAADGSPAASQDPAPDDAHPIAIPADAPLLVSRGALINAVVLLENYQTFMAQAGGTLTLPGQANITTACVVTG